MAEMGRYCKAYYVKDFRECPGWTENLADLCPTTIEKDGEEVEIARTELEDDDILYLQEDFVVTDGIFKDENIVFAAVTDEWKAFCRDQLDFEIPAERLDGS